MNIIEMKNISYRYPDGTPALENININVQEGKKVVFLGENGSGKSTLFLLLNGIYKPWKGEYFFKGIESGNNKKERQKLCLKAGVVFQDPDVQLFAPTVFQEVAFAPGNMNLSAKTVKERTKKALEEVDLYHLKDRPPHYLSYGQKKRTAIADILAMETEVIILDEPLVWLDSRHKKAAIDLLDKLSAAGKTVIISTHDPDFACSWADYIYVLKEGKVFDGGTPGEVFADREKIESAGLEYPLVKKIAHTLGLAKTPSDNDELLLMLEQYKKIKV